MTSTPGAVTRGDDQIWQDFRCAPGSSICPDQTTIEAITKSGGRWRILLRNRFYLAVVLVQDFDLIDVKQLTQPPPDPPRI